MSRSGYSDDCEGWALIMWRGAVKSAIRGARGQAFLREALVALDAMPEKRLVTDTLHEPSTGEFCTLGVVGAARGIDMKPLESAEREGVAKAFGIAPALAAEIMFENDERYDSFNYVTAEICGPIQPGHPEYGRHERTRRVDNPREAEVRWWRMRAWIERNIKGETP